jgi:hypothetical protein
MDKNVCYTSIKTLWKRLLLPKWIQCSKINSKDPKNKVWKQKNGIPEQFLPFT